MSLRLQATRKDDKITFLVVDTERSGAILSNMSEHEVYVYLLRRRIAEAITRHDADFPSEVAAALSSLPAEDEGEDVPF